jgi:hypothetical protein
MSLVIQINDGITAFRPGETIAGVASWTLPAAPSRVDVELFWTTRGKGTVDSRIVEWARVEQPGSSGQKEFSFKAPLEPPSFSGKLVTLLWGLRLVVHPSQEQAQVNLTISPTGQEINLVF